MASSTLLAQSQAACSSSMRRRGQDLSRQGVSHFQASDLFGKLIESDLHCDSDPGGPNYIYPITGHDWDLQSS